MSKNNSSFDEYPEISAEDMARASFRVGTKKVTQKEWVSAVSKKQRISIMLDERIVSWFKAQAGDRGYQTLINETLKQAINNQDLEGILRRIVREELKHAA